MTKNPITVSGNTPIFKIEQIFKEQKIWSLIIEDCGKYIGIITKSDLKRRGKNRSPKTLAFTIMTRSMITIDPDADVESAIKLIFGKNIDGLPVVKDGTLYGIITKYDIRNKYLNLSENGLESVRKSSMGIDKSPIPYIDQKKFLGQKSFTKRLKEDIVAIFIEYFILPLKRSYHKDTIKFLAILAMDIGLLGISILSIWFTLWIFFFRKNFALGTEQPPIEPFVIAFGFFALLLISGSMILSTKRQQEQNKIDIIHHKEENSLTDSISIHKFEIALSFSGKHRNLVEEIAFGIREELGNNSVFYDNFYKAHLAQPNLDLLLQKIYKNNSKLNVIFLSSDYEDTEWCGIEFRAIRELIKTGHSSKIMLLKLGDVNIEGLFTIDGYLDVRNMSALEISNHILDRINGLGSESSSSSE